MNLTRSDGKILLAVSGIALIALAFTGVTHHSNSVHIGAFTQIAEPIRNLDINRASYADLVKLDGIGPTLAKRILSARMLHGPFTEITQIKDVNGIGDMRFESLSKQIIIRSVR